MPDEANHNSSTAGSDEHSPEGNEKSSLATPEQSLNLFFKVIKKLPRRAQYTFRTMAALGIFVYVFSMLFWRDVTGSLMLFCIFLVFFTVIFEVTYSDARKKATFEKRFWTISMMVVLLFMIGVSVSSYMFHWPVWPTTSLNISGQVTSAVDGLPIRGAFIDLNDYKQITETKSDGSYELFIDEIEKNHKELTLNAYCLGYKKEDRPVRYEGSKQINIDFKLEPVESND